MWEVKNIFEKEKVLLQLMFNPGLMLTGFRKTRLRCSFKETYVIAYLVGHLQQ